ncbi:hypothetical protein [Niallia sp. NCCP-28]|uniref:hypothetical protein n=1 Tax=Niallia sp. NCCP-28 TaxID=2934712 RepID=UPI0020887AA0|nr:hypothetical protein [Niallia sp. NCCP-28]GKU81353.1 hypothetical protein NCCP28_07490 [Niallia sp. NCCP-28]
MKKSAIFFILILLVALVAYIETPNARINKQYVYYYGTTDESEEASTSTESLSAPELEYQLDSTVKEGGYILETYREYEIYKDKNGEVIKTKATSNTQTIKYAEDE